MTTFTIRCESFSSQDALHLGGSCCTELEYFNVFDCECGTISSISSVASASGDNRALNSDQFRVINAPDTAAQREAHRVAAFGTARRSVRDHPIFSDRVRVNLITSFTGKDRLYTRLEANNITPFNASITGTNELI